VDDIIEVIFSPYWRGVGVGEAATPTTAAALTTTTTTMGLLDTASVTTNSTPLPPATVETESTTATTTPVHTTEQDELPAIPQRFPTNVPLPQMVVSKRVIVYRHNMCSDCTPNQMFFKFKFLGS
jgi:hypothetical protein